MNKIKNPVDNVHYIHVKCTVLHLYVLFHWFHNKSYQFTIFRSIHKYIVTQKSISK